ncbi:MAG: DUF1553 domain-containing protein [Candidatus Hydrogenedens sp.]|nr:DUF1553 domain-containing protein [Candidatus Hydrogenedens sp.]
MSGAGLASALAAVALVPHTARAEASAFFHEQVAPLLAGRCLECHSAGGKGGLDLRSKETAFTGDDGAVVVPGDPAASLLYEYVSTHEMPPKKPLEPAEIEVFRQWITEGAFFPDEPINPFAITSDRRAGYDWWSLQPLSDAAPPTDAANPIDAFVQAKLDASGLVANPPASPRDLIRRATYDLTGLPPTPEETESFVTACREETGNDAAVGDAAYGLLLDRLLASPRYGEQWGRHWLDIVRYGESNGYERNVLFDNIWPYRDYVIQSFNEDKPFTRFTLEQLAADSLDPGNPDVEVAMTFLVCGPYDDVGNQDPVKAAQIRADAVDEMIRTTSEAFLGLTVGCARCHDHKFDPIAATDYYRMYATFAGVSHGDREVATREQERERADLLKPLIDARNTASAERDAFQQAIVARSEARAAELEAFWTRPAVSRNLTEETFPPVEARFVRLMAEGRDDDPYAVSGFRIDEFEAWTAEESPRNVAAASTGATARGASRAPGDFADAYEADLAIDGKYGARWQATGPELVIEFAQPETIARVSFSSDRNAALAEGHPETPFISEYRIEVSMDGEAWTEVANARDRKPSNDRHRLKRLIDNEITAEERARLAELDAASAAAQAAVNAVPPLPRLRVGLLRQPDADQHVFIGGSPQRPGDAVVPASLSTLESAAGAYALPADAPEKERRHALAKWITHKDNPLPARVLANRLWQYHFGTGLADSPSDFGFMGSPPSHPALLDWLARELQLPSIKPGGGDYSLPERIGEAWRLKRMHKLIMLSDAYRRSAAWNETAAASDADSRLLWRFPPRRLRAEELRDTMLEIAGVLDTRMGGPGFRLYNYLNDNVSTYVPLNEYGPETYRRSVYHQQARAMYVDLVTDFDAPDCAFSVAKRVDTTTPLQALTLLNHDFTMEMADALAARVQRDAGPESRAQLARAYALAFNRAPAPEELDTATTLVEKYGMPAFCRALLNANELLYLQ